MKALRVRFGRWLEQWLISHGILATPEEDAIYDAIDRELRLKGQ